MSPKLMIVSDAWEPQTNGVVRCLGAVKSQMEGWGYEVDMLTPDRFWRMPMPSYPEIQLAMAPPGIVGRLIDESAPNFIHIATEGPLGFQARLHCDWHQVPFTTSYHTRFPEYLAARVPVPEGVSYSYLRWFHWEAQQTLVPTQSVANDLAKNGFRQTKVWTRGINRQDFFPAPKSLFLDLPAPHLLYVGRVSVEKNVEAFLEMSNSGSKIVVGDGPQLTELREKYPNAHFLGKKTGAELRAAYQSADVFVFPSKTDTFGNVMLEALGCGTPVAAYPVTGPIDVITDPKAGSLDTDLGEATRQALTLSRTDALAHSKQFSWENCAIIFKDTLVSTQKRSKSLS